MELLASLSLHRGSIMLMLMMGMWACQPAKNEINKPSRVFLIYVDDLRPELGCYGNPWVESPHLDRLAKDALVFNRAYANVPVCGASRASMLSGMRPSRQRFLEASTRVEEDAPGAITLPAYLKQKGYVTLSMGKVFHHKNDCDTSWSHPPYRGPKQCNKDYALQVNIDIDNHNPRRRAGAFEIADTTDEAYLDGKLAQYAISQLDSAYSQDTSLFMAVGFYKPHLPFTAPKRYWDLYDPTTLPFPHNYYVPKAAPASSMTNYGELRSYTDIPDGDAPLDSVTVQKLIHGYYACVSYTDAQVGKFIQSLKDRDLYESSTIVVVGDHGWFLGEHTLWCKHANYRAALRTALMIKFPQNTHRGHSDLPVELVELYPSLVEIVGLEAPAHLQANSFLPYLEDATLGSESKEVYCRFQDGETLIQGSLAFTEYVNDSGEVYARMLYEHQADPQENHNVAELVEPSLVNSLSQKLTNYRKRYDQ